MTKRPAIKTKKTCVVCGEDFFGTASKQTCDGRCRTKLARLKAAQKRPEYILIAKGKGQKIPDLNAPKRLVFKKGEKKPKPEFLDNKVVYAVPDEKAFDGEKISSLVLDEPGQFEMPTPLTDEQKLAKRMELGKKLEQEEKRQHQMGDGHPKTWRLTQDEKISKIKQSIEEI